MPLKATGPVILNHRVEQQSLSPRTHSSTHNHNSTLHDTMEKTLIFSTLHDYLLFCSIHSSKYDERQAVHEQCEWRSAVVGDLVGPERHK